MCTSTTYPAATLPETTKTAAAAGVNHQESDFESNGNDHEVEIRTLEQFQDSEAEADEEAKDQVQIVTPRGKTPILPGPVSHATANLCTSTYYYPAPTLESDFESDDNDHEAAIGTFEQLQDGEAEEAEDQVRGVRQ
jgi:hypothetical protein